MHIVSTSNIVPVAIFEWAVGGAQPGMCFKFRFAKLLAFPALEPATGVLPHRTPPTLTSLHMLTPLHLHQSFHIFLGRLPPCLLRLAPHHTATPIRQDFYRKSVFETKYLFTVNDMDLHLMVRDNNTVGAFSDHGVASHGHTEYQNTPLLILHRPP